MSIEEQIDKAKDSHFKQLLIDFYSKASKITPPSQKSPTWEIVHSNFAEQITQSDTSFYEDINNNIGKRNDFSLICSTSDRRRQNVADFYIRCLAERGIDATLLLQPCNESPLLQDELCINYKGQRISTDLLRRVTHLSYIEEKLQFKDNSTVIEIGAGHGAMARLIKSKYPNTTYVIIDLPETLYYSTGFLLSSFPNAKSLLATKKNTADLTQESITEYDFIFLPIGTETTLDGMSFDLLINTHSLGEVPSEVSQYWFDFFQNFISVRQFFMINRFLNRRKWGSTYPGNVCSTGFDRSWHIHEWSVDPKFTRSAHEIWEPRYLMVLGEKSPPPLSDEEAIELSHERCMDAKGEPWYQQLTELHSTGGIALVDHHYPVYERNYDMDRTSSLFRCWDAVRLHACKESLTTMLMMLRFLAGSGRAFNEAHIYASKLERLENPPFKLSDFRKYD